MDNEAIGRCARCGALVEEGDDLCPSCSSQFGSSLPVMLCRACGASNISSAPICRECKAPLSAKPKQWKTLNTATGRLAELTVLEDCFKVCMEKNHVGGAIVTGELGMGVTTLFKAFAEQLTGRISERQITYVQCRETEEPFSPLRRVLLGWIKLEKNEDPVSHRLRLANTVAKMLGASSAAQVTETSHLLGHAVGVPFPDSPVLKTLQSNHKLMQQRLKETLVRFMEAYLKKEPNVIIFDDLHLASEESRRLTLDILSYLKPVPLMAVIGGRPEVNDVTDNPSVVRISLEPLDNRIMRKLFLQFMPKLKSPPKELVATTIERAGGNPGTLNQLCALLAESGVVNTSGEEWTADVSKLSIAYMPVNMLETLKARVSQLDKKDKLVLEYAAVFGEVFWDEAVVSLLRQRTRLKEKIGAAQIWADDSDGLTVASSLDRLVERQFVVRLPETDIEGCIKYTFPRSGIRNEIINELDPKRLKQDHYLAAEWLRNVATRVRAGFAEAEAFHWIAAGEKHKAALACFRAARTAKMRYHHQKAIKLFLKGLELADRRNHIAIADAYHDLGSVYDLLGHYEKAEQCFTDMLKNAWILIHRGKAGAALNRIGRLYRARGDGAAAQAFLNRSMALFKAAGDEKGVAACLGDLGELARRQGSYDRAFKLVSEALQLQRKMDNKPSIAVSLQSLGHIETARAAYAQAERYLEEALDFRRQAGDKGGMAQTLSTLAIVLFSRGDLDKAIARWEAALGLAEEVGDRRMLAIVNNNLGEALRDQGKLSQSWKYFKACEEVVKTLDDGLLHSEVARNMGILAHKMGDLDSARQYLDKSLKLAEQMGGKEMVGLSYRALGELEATTVWDTSNVERGDESEIAFDKALKIFKSIGNDFEVARTLHAKGNRYLERGDVQSGRKILEEAKTIFKRIDSKAGDKISRTIKEIVSDNTPSRPPPPPAPQRKNRR